MEENDPTKSPLRFSEMPTPGGYLCGEVASALQKAIRRGNEREALLWASELDLAGYGGYVWKRLRIIASEDVGLADPQAVLLTRALYDNWAEAKKAKNEDALPLFLVHAVIVLARARKSGVNVHAWMAFYEGDRQAMSMEIPDHALDMHTARGRRMGRGKQHFLDEAGRLENETLPDPYREEGVSAWTSKTSRQPRRPAFGGSGRPARARRRGQVNRRRCGGGAGTSAPASTTRSPRPRGRSSRSLALDVDGARRARAAPPPSRRSSRAARLDELV